MYKKIDNSKFKQNRNFRWWLDRKNFLTKQECEDFIKRIDNDCVKKVKDVYYGKDSNPKYKEDPAVCNLNVAVYDDLEMLSKYWMAFKIANQVHYKYDIGGIHRNEYTGHRYDVGNWYTPHADFHPSHDFTIVKMTGIVFLNNDYEGGEFKLFDDTIIEPEIGRLVIFPSFAGHEVKPVTKGVRYTSVCWVAGDTFV